MIALISRGEGFGLEKGEGFYIIAPFSRRRGFWLRLRYSLTKM